MRSRKGFVGRASALVIVVAWGLAACNATKTAPTSHFASDGVSFDYPSSWNAATFNELASFFNVIVHLSTENLADPCDRDANSVACTRLAVTRLGPSGVLVSWTSWGYPPGSPIETTTGAEALVGGRPARVEDGAASGDCQAVGGVRQVVVKVPDPLRDSSWFEVDACLAGPSTDAARADIDAMLRSVVWQ